VSEVLDNSGDAKDEANQEDTTNTRAEDSNQGQDVNQDDTSTLGDGAADLDDVNVAVPLALSINVQDEEVEEGQTPTTPPPSDDDGELPPPEFAAFCFELGGIPSRLLCLTLKRTV
jgi:hypothetical protein